LHDKDFAHSTALGKAILSGMSTEMANSKIDKFDFRRLTLRTITNVEDFKKIVIQTRRVGYAIDDQENELGARCVAVAIFDNERFPIAAISVSGPVSRMDAEKIKLIVESLKRLSLTITESLSLK
jgi:IclR family acetate operon transcriptional repressor